MRNLGGVPGELNSCPNSKRRNEFRPAGHRSGSHCSVTTYGACPIRAGHHRNLASGGLVNADADVAAVASPPDAACSEVPRGRSRLGVAPLSHRSIVDSQGAPESRTPGRCGSLL